MPVRPDTRNIPTVADAVERFVVVCEVGQKAVKDHRSTLLGPKHRVVGKRAAGTTLARCELGGLRMDRVEAVDYARWFGQRHPNTQAPSTRKRGMSSLRTFLAFSCAQGWADERILGACTSIRASEPLRDWLRPEQVAAIQPIVESGVFDDYEQFAWLVLLMCGLRPSELVDLRGRALVRADRMLVIEHGKGRGAGKRRHVPVDDEFISRWDRFRSEHGIGPNDWVFYSRAPRFLGGAHREVELVCDKTKPSSPQPIRRRMRRIREEVEAAARRGEFDREQLPDFELTPKVLRRTFACCQLIANTLGVGGLDIRSLQLALGHTSLDVTAMYLADVDAYLHRTRTALNTLAAARRITEFLADERAN